MPKQMVFSNRYKWPVRVGVGWIILLGLLSAFALDMGQAFTIFHYTLYAYAPLLPLILFRRPDRPTASDILVLKWGFPALYSVGLMVYPYVWHLRGVR